MHHPAGRTGIARKPPLTGHRTAHLYFTTKLPRHAMQRRQGQQPTHDGPKRTQPQLQDVQVIAARAGIASLLVTKP